jgi:hypothetical protein
MANDILYNLGGKSVPGVQVFPGGAHPMHHFGSVLGMPHTEAYDGPAGMEAPPSGLAALATRGAANVADMLAYARLPGAARASNALWSKYYGSGAGQKRRKRRRGGGPEEDARRDRALDIVQDQYFRAAIDNAMDAFERVHKEKAGVEARTAPWDAARGKVAKRWQTAAAKLNQAMDDSRALQEATGATGVTTTTGGAVSEEFKQAVKKLAATGTADNLRN